MSIFLLVIVWRGAITFSMFITEYWRFFRFSVLTCPGIIFLAILFLYTSIVIRQKALNNGMNQNIREKTVKLPRRVLMIFFISYSPSSIYYICSMIVGAGNVSYRFDRLIQPWLVLTTLSSSLFDSIVHYITLKKPSKNRRNGQDNSKEMTNRHTEIR